MGTSRWSKRRRVNEIRRANSTNAIDDIVTVQTQIENDVAPEITANSHATDSDAAACESTVPSKLQEQFAEEKAPDRAPLDVKLAQLALKHRWTHSSLKDLLGLLRDYKDDIPVALSRDPRTILGTPRSVQVQQLNQDGSRQYYHFGIQYSLEVILQDWPECLPEDVILDMQLSIDGLPVTMSTRASVHPILGRLTYNNFESAVFCIGVYYGKFEKPENSHMLLTPFKDEYLAHREVGYVVHGKRVFVNVTAVICDKVERDLVRQTIGHTGFGTCDRCEVHGISGKSVSFPDLNAPLRTDESFTARRHEIHHKKLTPSAFELCGFGMVTKFPLDVMHMVFLGVMKRLISQWHECKRYKWRIDRHNKKWVSDCMSTNCARSCPSNFQRKPRGLDQYKQFKATEFRSFLLYVGPVVMQSKLDERGKQYKHFMLLCVAMRILLCNRLREQYIDTAEDMLKLFVERFKEIYGPSQITYNVHSMIHLAQDARWHGDLNTVNAFPFESHLGRMRKTLRRHGRVLQQLVKREYEHQHIIAKARATCTVRPVSAVKAARFLGEHKRGPLPDGVVATSVRQYKVCFLSGVRYSCCPRDCAVSLPGSGVGKIVNILVQQLDNGNKLVTFAVRFYRRSSEFFNYPLCLSKVGIVEVHSLSKTVSEVNVGDCVKVWLMERQDKRKVAVELLH